MKLVRSEVEFMPQSHTYLYKGKELSGITSVLKRQLFQDQYSGIPDSVLAKAAERGTMIHQSCELADDGFEVDLQEAKNYLLLKQKYGLIIEESEYLVSDNEYYASCIDKVYRYDDNTFFLGDIKTTYSLNKEYVMWQLSIYAYLFERQNPGAKVTSVFAIWLRGDTHQLVELSRVPDEEVEKLLYCDSHGLQYTKQETMPAALSDAELMIVELETKLKALTEQKKSLQDMVMRVMVQGGLYQWKGERVSITRKTATTRKSFDKEAFDMDYPGMYDKYVKETPVSESLLIKVK